ncbi:putative transcriptional regulator [Frankia torreyi]|uniref:Putative transcriptional regulator n=3 Tax=Frankia TaxID=1854 RepID=A0A0D8BPH1_9ACTN|nr:MULTISPECIES: MerR family transcriptional regulator [Frankia]KJE25272.1 putative transcriptional regulator [Frankia torreyi]KQC37775.1 MerR family transcriptional regulator [Frankia sp. ACN1ag]
MFSIGDFARRGLVSVRMLRHYDALGLLRPAHVDPVSGYRFYQADQFARLNRIIALKDLGLTLTQVRAILDEQVSVAELRGMLRLRQAELAAAIAADTARLARVHARLRAIECEGRMPTDDVLIKRLTPVRVAELVATAASYAPENIGPVVSDLFDDLVDRLARAGVRPTGPAVAYYTDATQGAGMISVHAALPVAAGTDSHPDFALVDLPEVPAAATLVHRGSMDEVVSSGQALAAWIDAHGYRAVGYPRELYLACPPHAPERWVTELQEPILEC